MKKKYSIDALNAKHAVVMIAGKCLVMNQVVNPITSHPDINFSSVPDFKNRYSNKHITVKNGTKETSIPLTKFWLESPERLQYEGIVFDPQHTPPDYYNLWKGLSVKSKAGNWAMMKDHIFEIIANGNTLIFNWFMAWLARIVQSPGGERPGTAVVLRGPQGTGKGCFASNFGRIFGPHYRHITNQKHLAGNFNAHLKDAIFVFIDEGFWAGDKSVEGVLKGLVTEDILLMEAKGKDAIQIHNHMNFLMASNNDWVVPAGFNERRFAVLDVSDKRAGDRSYFNELFKVMDNGGREAMLHDLLQMDISEVDLRTIPRTEALLDQMLATMDSVQAFWFDRLDAGTVLEDANIWPLSKTKKDVYEEYLNYCQKRNLRHKDGQTLFGRKLNKYCPGLMATRKGTTDYRPMSYQFPALAECRKAFEQITNMTVKWGE